MAAAGEGRLLVGGKGRGNAFRGKGCAVCHVCSVCRVRRARRVVGSSDPFAAFTSGFSSAGKTPVPVMSVFDVFFEKMPRC